MHKARIDRAAPFMPPRLLSTDDPGDYVDKAVYWLYDDEDGNEVWSWECPSCFFEGRSGPPRRVWNSACSHIESHFKGGDSE